MIRRSAPGRCRLLEFSNHFTGVVLELSRAEGFEPIEARTPMKLSILWSKMTGWWTALAGVLVLSVALQIAAFVAPLQMQLVVDQAIAEADRDLLTVIALAFGALVIMQAAIEALRGWALRVFGHLLSFQITGNIVRHLLRLPSDYFEKRHVGDIISRLGSVRPIQEAITQGVVGTVIDGIMACVAAVILFFYSTTLALIVIVAVLINLGLSLALLPRMKQRAEETILAEAKEQTHAIALDAEARVANGAIGPIGSGVSGLGTAGTGVLAPGPAPQPAASAVRTRHRRIDRATDARPQQSAGHGLPRREPRNGQAEHRHAPAWPRRH